MPTDDLTPFLCQNADCQLHGRRDAGNLLVIDHFGKAATDCSTAGPARAGSPSSRAPRCSTPSFHTTRSWRSWNTSPKDAASARPSAWSGSTRTPSRGWPCWPDSTTRPPTTSWWPFPPSTRKVQLDEKWSFVAKKQHNCDPDDPDDPDDDHRGDYCDHVADDPEHRSVLAVIPGVRSIENAEAIVGEVKQRLGGDAPDLMTSDEYPAYETAIERTFGEPIPPARGPGRPRIEPERRLPDGLTYATVPKHREGNRVVAVDRRLVFGTPGGLEAALANSEVSVGVNTSFLERPNGADRGRNARKARETYRFSKDWPIHEAMTYLTRDGDNFSWAVRTLRVKDGEGCWQGRSPAMAAGLSDQVWTWREWFIRPATQSNRKARRSFDLRCIEF